MNISYLIYQAERPKTAPERRDEAIRSGEFAMALSRLLPRRRRSHVSQALPACRPVPLETCG